MKDVRRERNSRVKMFGKKRVFRGRRGLLLFNKMSIAKIYHRLVRVVVYISDRFIDTIHLSLIT